MNTDTLKALDIRPTKKRMLVLNIFKIAKHPLSSKELYEMLSDSEGSAIAMDRVTVYRILDLFAEKGVLQRITSPDHTDRYCLADQDHHNGHPHFSCSSCGDMGCLPHGMFQIRWDENLQKRMQHFHIHVEGLCEKCFHDTNSSS